MNSATFSKAIMDKLINFQRNEITEYYLYTRLAKRIKDKNNAEVLERIGNDEKRHSEILKNYTKTEVKPNKLKITWFYWIARIFGLTFGIKLMERGEEKAQDSYKDIADIIPEVEQIMREEDAHEHELIDMLEEELLNYVGSIVLGLNDALVELTGALAGLSLALQNTRLIALAGLITGIAASMSMAASEFLSKKAEGDDTAAKSSTYTGIAYIITVALLVLPYLLFANYIVCLAFTLTIAILIIFVFNFYLSVAKDLNFWRRFGEMALISLGVSAVSFGVGYLIRGFLGVDV
jgi:vacuolar iron transporter family protein